MQTPIPSPRGAVARKSISGICALQMPVCAYYREIGEPIWERFQGKRDGTLWYYRELVTEFRRRKATRLTKELERVVTELETTLAERERSTRPRTSRRRK